MKLTLLAREKLLSKFDSLTYAQKQVLELRALLFALRNKTFFGQAVRQYNVSIGSDKTINTGSGPKISRELELLGYLDVQRHNVLPELRHPLTVKALDKSNPRRALNLKVAKGIYPLEELDLECDSWNDKDMPNEGALHIAIHENNDKPFKEDRHEQDINYQIELMNILRGMYVKQKLDCDWIETRNEIIRAWIYAVKLSSNISNVPKATDYNDIQQNYAQEKFKKLDHAYLSYILTQLDIVSGQLERAADKTEMIVDTSSGYYIVGAATQFFFKNDLDTAMACYKKALLVFKKYHKKRNWFFEDIHGVFYLLLIIYYTKNIADANKHIAYVNKQLLDLALDNGELYILMEVFVKLKLSERHSASKIFKSLPEKSSCLFYNAMYQLAQYAVDSSAIGTIVDKIIKQQKTSVGCKQLLAASIYGEVLQAQSNNDQYLEEIEGNKFRFLSLVEIKEMWEYTLNDLESLFLDKELLADAAAIGGDKRIIWLLNPEKETIQPVEQSLGKKGWSYGRNMSLKRLYSETDSYIFLTPQDKLALEGLKRKSEGWYGDYTYYFSPKLTLRNLIGHPHIYHLDNRSMRIDIVTGEPEVYIEQKDNVYQFNISHASSSKGYVLEQESMNRYKYIQLNDEYKKIASIVTNQGLSLPAKAKDRVLSIIQHAKKDIKLHSGIEDVDIPEVITNYIPTVQLLPIGESVQLSIWIKPFGEQGPYCKAAHGKKNIIATLMVENNEARHKAKRIFAKETIAVDKVLHQCSELGSYHMDSNVYLIDELEDVLETLSDLETLKSEDKVHIEWPQGEKYKIKKKVSGSNLSLNIKSEHNWFEYDGDLQIDEDQVLEMKELLESLKDNPTRFISLSNGEFIELTAAFRKQLGVLESISQDNKIYHLNANSLKDLTKEVDKLTVDTGWDQHVQQLKKMEKHNPKVPSTLQAELRDYQEDGYKYLSTLAHWGIGSCLADDMGLGKTIQAISLILEHTKRGPTLVIAPTSVCFNWVEEINKFAPTLNTHLMYNLDRENGVEKLKSMDVLICSYGLLHHNIKVLSEHKWQTIILDEAQAIKNPHTRRWKAVMQLQSKVRVALTGTPIENHLGELWSILNFVNPGMLGNLKYFQKRFSQPIEQDHNQHKMQALKTLAQPYILRRLKLEVLDELPPKTEQTIYIEPSEEEMAFYDALRQTAEQNLISLDQNNRIAILAEITKLRLACCDSSLINPEVNITNSKLDYFRETLKNIIDNGHKVLVFSQYVKFLDKIQTALQEDKVNYQYIDGSTPQAKRKTAVNAFQAGDGDVFLLSLKAGGSGLNLTAADYVIHLDPWWNPAVEDQASDRAHRIGQDRPVTIYRLIMKNTIEEKIINLHKTKRDLANDLLSGKDISGKISEEQLLELITG